MTEGRKAMTDHAQTKLPTVSAMITALGYMRMHSERMERDALTVSGSGEGAEIYRDAARCIEFALRSPAIGTPDELTDLVNRFAAALLEKLRAAEQKYGYQNDWARDGWKTECQRHLNEHLAKGDPRDVAAYCAFLWHHGWPTIGTPDDAREALEKLKASIDTRINDLLCETKPNFDDSITGINDAWDVVRKACDKYIALAALSPSSTNEDPTP